ncbi:de59bd48-ff8c-44bb-9daa-8e2ccbac04d6 [Thermothielavioides terrestris]|uniref:De59bd48-ff8c-44bb-9daa-8e2ccbac04d6 n=1 Tax=Thermothielavioides terrestris TaxID=2587410 RepID=A0A3S4EX81_9PEZI|nr:de59bd48-ff8c-44bb-9daa-8e2ccbac04d6 [Thermothielavioides terrestris]
MNAVAIVPLAGVLSYATESVASRLGDTVGALMNVTFGNAVELIIFIIALVQNHIRIVQASLVGSILVNLLLILGMCFLLGGLRFREQIYNSTVTQMSACLLALSVISLLLPTAFHASFSSETRANNEVLQVSRGTSVIMLIVYFLYLVFQLKSHSYIYASTPQGLVDREAVPGPAAQYFNSSGSEGSSSDSDSDGSPSRSSKTARRLRRMMRKGKRAQSVGSDGGTNPDSETAVATTISSRSNGTGTTDSPDAVEPNHAAVATDEKGASAAGATRSESPRRDRKPKHKQRSKGDGDEGKSSRRHKTAPPSSLPTHDGTGRSEFAAGPALEAQTGSTQPRPFSARSLLPLIPDMFASHPANNPERTSTEAGNVHASVRRARTEPVRGTQASWEREPPLWPMGRTSLSNYATNPEDRGSSSHPPFNRPDQDSRTARPHHGRHQPPPSPSRTTAVILLLLSTGLVAVCAEFMVSSIDRLVAAAPGLSEAFIGLVLLPLVGNAAEHATAVSVALKNKVDLAIGVAVGSSIQIALFVTPLVVILGWALGRDMSLFFTLFETVCVFVSAFIVNFLVLDGRSNYLEGALLCAAYVIIAVAAFFYPDSKAANVLGGGG